MSPKIIIISIFLLVIGITGGYFLGQKNIVPLKPAPEPQDKYVSFLMEIYDKIKDNYWDKISDENLINIYFLSLGKITNQPLVNQPKNRDELKGFLRNSIQIEASDQKKKELAANLAGSVLTNLQPFGRSGLYSQKDETALKNNVENKASQDHYQALGVEKTANTEEIKSAYDQNLAKLKNDNSTEAAQKKKDLALAFQALSDTNTKKTYDSLGVDPTIEYKLLRPDILYLHMKKFSPTTLDELNKIAVKFDTGDVLNSMILDLRDNVGGLIDGLPYFLGPFIGNDQYAYQFFHHGEKEDFKTKTGFMSSLSRYKKVIVLINRGSQSSAEVMAATLKKYNVGILVGTPTKGWGTVEKVFSLDNQIDPSEKYSIFLVHSLTLREDGQPIEGKGVEPLVNIDNPGWENQLLAYYRYEELVKAIKEVW
jgi:hypothetical protein